MYRYLPTNKVGNWLMLPQKQSKSLGSSFKEEDKGGIRINWFNYSEHTNFNQKQFWNEKTVSIKLCIHLFKYFNFLFYFLTVQPVNNNFTISTNDLIH